MRKTIKGYLPVLVTLIIAIITVTLILTGNIDLNVIPEIVDTNRIGAVSAVLALFVLKGLSGAILYDALALLVSVMFPLRDALLLSAVGTAVELAVSYMIGRATKTQSMEQLLSKNERIEKYFGKVRQYGFVSCFALHAIGLNMEVLGIVFGVMRADFWQYLASSWLGVFPSAICFILIGSTKNVRSPVFWISVIFKLAMIVFGIVYIQIKNKRKKQKEPER